MRTTLCPTALGILLILHASLLWAQDKKKAEPATPERVVKESVCQRAANPMEIDGALTDWQDVDAHKAMVLGEAESVQKPKRYKGPQDASALVYTKWDDKNFYLAAVVTDDFARNTHVEKELQEGDGILLCLSPKTPAEYPAAKPDQPPARYPYGFIVTAGDGEKVRPQLMVIMDAEKKPLIAPGPWLDEVKKAAKRTKTGYNLELSIPFSATPELKPAVGLAIGCEVCLYESDTRVGPTKRTTILGWCSVKDRMNPAEGGKLMFTDASKEKFAESPGSLRAEELIKNPYKPAAEEYVARKPQDAFAAAGIPFGLYFERAERAGIVRKLKDERLGRLFSRITVMCESYLITWHPEKYSMNDLSASDAEMVSKVIQRLGFLYTLTEEDAYADLARRTMLRVCEQSGNWSRQLDRPEHLRAAAHLLRGLAIGSDWTHNALNMEERELVEKTLTESGEKLAKAAVAAKVSPADKVVTLSAVGICGAATRKRNDKARDWMESAERAVAQYAASGWDKNPDDMDAALFSIFTLADPVKKALGHDLFSVIDMRAAISKCADGLRTTVPSGGAIDFVSARYSSQVHACVLLRSAMENNDGLAMWLYQNIFKDAPASSRDADEIYSLLWFDERAKPAPPTWFTEKSQAELAAKLEKIVKEACLADAAERVKARGRLRPTVKAQRALAVPFSAEWLQKADTSVLADFQVSIKPELLEQHPRLFFTKNEMPLLYARIASCQAKMWEPFIEFMEKNLTTPYRTMQSYREQGGLGTGTGDTLAAFAFTYALAKDDAYGEIVKRFVQGYCAEEIWDPPHPDLVHAHVLTGLSLAYDVAQQCLMPEERLMVRDKLILEARRMFTGTCAEKRVRTPGNANNHSWIQKCGLAIAATAIYEHAPEAKAWLDRVRWEYEKILEVHGPDGASCEGTSYWAYGLQWMLKYMELLRHTSGEDMYEYPWLRQTGYYALYCLSPGGALHVNFGDNGEDQGRVSFIPYRLASEFRDEHIQWLGDLLHWNPNLKGKSGASMWSLLWYDPTVAVKAPNDLPPYRYFDDLEMVIVKSGWQDDARMLAFRCGPPMGHSVFAHGAGGYGHAHPDQNHFIFFAGGSRFIVSDPGYSRWKMTSEHNLVLVDGLGQIGEEEHWLHYVYKADELAEMQEVFLSPSYSYMRGQALKAYRREAGVQNFTREVMFLDGKYLIAFDTVNTDAPRKYEWLLHSWNPIQSEKNGLFTSTQDDARLATALLMPEQFEQKTEAMMVKSAVKWGLDGKPIYVQEPVQHGYYLTVWPKEKTPTANFLAVLWPYTKGAEDKVPKIVRFAGENCIGAAIDEPEQRDRIIFNLSGAPVEAEGISTDAPRAVVRLNEAYEPTAYIVHGGRTLTCGACELVRSSGPVVLQFDAISGKGVLQAKTPGDIALYAPRAVKSVKANAEVRPFTYDSKTKTVRFQAAQGRADLAIE